MIKKIILSVVLVFGFSAQAKADIRDNSLVMMSVSIGASIGAIAIANKLIPPCKTPTPTAAMFCMMVATAVAQAGVSMLTARGAHKSAVQASSDIGGLDWDDNLNIPEGFDPNNISDPKIGDAFEATSIPGGSANAGTAGALQTRIEELQKEVEDKGYVYNPEDGSVTGPDGKKTSASAITAASSSTVPGLAADASEKSKQVVAALQEKFGLSGGAGGFTNPGGGGSSYANSYKDDYGDDDYNSSMNSLLSGLKKKGKRKPASVKGLVKKIGNGDAIGVAGDNIFEMIARGYKHKIKTKQLIGN